MQVITTARELRVRLAVTGEHGRRRSGGPLFVPTMGALHEGHFTLVREAARLRGSGGGGGRGAIVVSIFVNPTQFNDPKDLERYPRTLERDVAGCEAAGADVVFAPSVSEVYPQGAALATPALPRVAQDPGLEDAHRPGHFAGVCQVVGRLFDLVRPDAALFGEKDWQQLQVVKAMTREGGLKIRIVGVETVRDPDGLAMSSRNVFLSASDRSSALAIPRALKAAREHRIVAAAEGAMRHELEGAGLIVDYAVIRDAETLMPIVTDAARRECRALIVARAGGVRLLDNGPWG